MDLGNVGGWSDGFLELYAFFVEHRPCPDQHLVVGAPADRRWLRAHPGNVSGVRRCSRP